MTILEIIALVLAIAGSVFTLLGAVGVLRMPDAYTRLSTAAKTSTLGVAAMVAAAAVYHGETGLGVRALFVIAFILLTVPVASHLIGRAAYISHAKLWDKTSHDALKGKYDREAHTLKGDDSAGEEG